jgi:phosphoglycerate dehydrogenase-like enzyme
MFRLKIGILDDYQEVARGLADWGSLDADVVVFTAPFVDADEVVTQLADFDVLVAMRERTRFPAEVLSRLRSLKLLVSTGTANPAIDVVAATELGVVVSGTGYCSYPTAELTWALILAAARKLPQQVQSMRTGGWQLGLGTSVRGLTLGVLGLGNVGQQVAAIAPAFGMRVIAWSENLTAERAAGHEVTAVSRERLFAEADVLSIHVLLSQRSRGMVGAPELAMMKPTSILVNTSRGPIVDEGALVDALRRHVISCAALDVYETEPLPGDHPLRSLDNALLTPHIGYVSQQLYSVFYRDAVEDIAAFIAGSPVRVIRTQPKGRP